MTTAVYIPSEGLIAYDSRLTEGDSLLTDDFEKLSRFGDIRIIAAGTLGDDIKIAQAFIGESDYTNDFAALIIHEDDVYAFYRSEEKGLQSFKLTFPYAVGTGEKYAQAGIKMGLNAVQCVELASKCDVNTGGRVRTLSV